VYSYETTELVHQKNTNDTYQWVVKPKTVKYDFKTQTNVPKLGYYNFLFLILDYLFKILFSFILLIYLYSLLILSG
jgi:hypothetical protein